MISTSRPDDHTTMPYLKVTGSGVVLAKDPDGNEHDADGGAVALSTMYDSTEADNHHWVINIDVDEMTRNKTVTLTVYNLAVGELLDNNGSSAKGYSRKRT